MSKKTLLVIAKIVLALWVSVFFIIIICRVQYKPIVIHSEKIMNIISVLWGFPKESAKAFAFPPFVVLRFQEHEMNDIRIHHENIHHYQMIETAGLIQLYSWFEYLYARYILWYDHMDAYLFKTTEQEAYLNQETPSYLQSRKIFGFGKYMKQKTRFSLIDYRVVKSAKSE